MLVLEPDLYGARILLDCSGSVPVGGARKSLLRVALKKLSRNDHAYVVGPAR
jgi:hypothetical protein